MKKKLEYINGLIHEEHCSEEDTLTFHRLDGPAITHYNQDVSTKLKQYYIESILYTDKLKYSVSTSSYKEVDKMKNHIVEYYQNGNIKTEQYFKKGMLHRLDGPAIIGYCNDDDGSISEERYYVNGKLHRLDGPAIIYYDENGKIKSEYWYKNGKRHRLNGPAIIQYNKNSSIKQELYFINGEEYNELEHIVKAEIMKG